MLFKDGVEQKLSEQAPRIRYVLYWEFRVWGLGLRVQGLVSNLHDCGWHSLGHMRLEVNL